jgi:hypothetical protein
MAVKSIGETIPEIRPPFEIDFLTDGETMPGLPRFEIGCLPTPPPSLPDIEPWDNLPDSPSLLDILDRSEGSVSSGRSESPLRLENDTADVFSDVPINRGQPRAETFPTDSSTEVRDELTYGTADLSLRGGDETFLSFAVDNFFEHASSNSELDLTHLEVLRARCSTDLHLQIDLEARVLHWIYQVSS